MAMDQIIAGSAGASHLIQAVPFQAVKAFGEITGTQLPHFLASVIIDQDLQLSIQTVGYP